MKEIDLGIKALDHITTCTNLDGKGCVFPFTYVYSDSTSETFDYMGSYDRVHSIWKWDDEKSKWLAFSHKPSIAKELEEQGYTTFSTVEKGQGYWVRLSVSGIPTSLSHSEPPAI